LSLLLVLTFLAFAAVPILPADWRWLDVPVFKGASPLIVLNDTFGLCSAEWGMIQRDSLDGEGRSDVPNPERISGRPDVRSSGSLIDPRPSLRLALFNREF